MGSFDVGGLSERTDAGRKMSGFKESFVDLAAIVHSNPIGSERAQV